MFFQLDNQFSSSLSSVRISKSVTPSVLCVLRPESVIVFWDYKVARFFVGKYFSGYEKIQLEITQYEKENFVNLAKKHSRTIENAIKHGSNKSYNSEWIFPLVNFVCKHSCALMAMGRVKLLLSS